MAKRSQDTPHIVEKSPTILVVGAESLLGKELRELLDRKGVPARIKLISVEEEGGILTEQEGEPVVMGPLGWQDLKGGKAVMLAGSPESSAQALERVRSLKPRPAIIDVTGTLDDQPAARLRAPGVESPAPAGAEIQVIAHPAAIVLALFLTRVHTVSPIRHSVVQIFEPASERGQRGLDELQQQTVGLLAFQKLKKDVYDTQASFNMLAQYGADAPKSLAEIELKIDRHLRTVLSAGGPPMPSLRLIQAPVFHGYSFSIWIEFDKNPGVAALSAALASGPIEVRTADQEPPSNVGIAGQSGVAVGGIEVDRNQPQACWFWVVADNLRIAAESAVEVVSDGL